MTDDRTLRHMSRRLAFSSLLRGAALAASLTALAATSGGCTPKAPILTVQGAQIGGGSVGITFPGGISANVRMIIFLSAQNENSFDIQVRGTRGQVSMLGGRFVLPVSAALGVWLPSDQSTAFQVPVEVPIGTALAVLQSTYGMSCIPWTVQGVADVTATSTFKLDQDNYPFAQSGCIPRQALVNAARMSPAGQGAN